MKNFLFWQRWLFIVSVIISVFGIGMSFLSGTSLFDIFNRQIDPVFWGGSPVQVEAKEFQKWVYGVLGATLAGWGVFFSFMAHYPFGRREKWAWNCMTLGLLVWFVLDTTISVNYKVYFNAIFNTILVILIGLPILFTRKHFT